MATKRKANAGDSPERQIQIKDWASHTVAQLRTELSSRGLSLTGKKADLVMRLETDDSANSAIPGQVANNGQESVNYKSQTIAQLKFELITRGLSPTGKKVDLVARLEAHDNSPTVETDPAAKRAKTINAVESSSAGPSALTANTAAASKSKSKAKKKGPPKDIEIEGPLASDVIVNKYTNRETGERRQRQFVPAPDEKFKQTSWRILNERMFMLDRRMTQDRQGHACQVFEIAGSTGNIYTVNIGTSPKCDCMDARIRGQKCKHINYALIVILKAPVYFQYQLAFLSDELESIFANAPVTRAPDEHGHEDDSESLHDGTRKPIEGECPICVFPMEAGEEQLVWCKAACGQNFHKECFDQWKRSKHGGLVTCVYCRTEWQEDGPKKGPLALLSSSALTIGSYRNIGHHEMYRLEEAEQA